MFDYEKYITNHTWAFHEKKHEIIQLIQDAGLKDVSVPFAQKVGSTHISTGNASAFDNLTTVNSEMAHIMHSLFSQAIGVYKKRVFDSIKPIYWVETIIFLPQKVICYLGINEDSKMVVIAYKTLNIVYWVISTAVTFLKLIQP